MAHDEESLDATLFGRAGDAVVFAVAAAISLFVLTAPDRGLAATVIMTHGPGRLQLGPERFLWDWRIASTGMIALLYLLTDRGRSWVLPAPASRRVAGLVGSLWLGAVLIGSFGLGIGTDRYTSLSGAILFCGVGVVAEELLFRGALFVLAQRAFASTRWSPTFAAVVVTAALFALGPLQYFGYSVTRTWHLRAYTPVLGLLLGWLRAKTGSIGPPILVHALGNTLALLGGTL